MYRTARHIGIVSTLALALALAGCTSGSTTKRTVTVVNTVTSGAAASKPTSSVVVGSPPTSAKPSTSAPASSTTPKPTKTSPTKTSVTAAPIVKLDPLKADCTDLLTADDVKAAIGATIGSATNRIRLGAGDRGATGAIRCLYGSTDKGKTAPVRVRLTQYSSAAAAKKQIGVDVAAAQDAGAKVTTPTIEGYPSSLQLKAGGVIEMQYGTWTLSLAVSDKLASDAKLTSGLPDLAGQVLTRLVKNG
ncbi:hypothetical protein SAMN04515671_3696 [Nakamurella panacisegetis]|uniref:DUF3558 domain-containing protein n=1 Tax=Nakamurella panacisegetis TaxID=1090615 RepID=A0A1H0RQ12_9ACTN|nr:hypothetical protein [Nakamurella panacisegetis]SDP31574.1 hypothetical protein SAMN04515671_3696 [Nakamurella panacisegetis]